MAYKEEYLIKIINTNNIYKTINNFILERKKKIIRFNFDCRIDSLIEKYKKK